MLDIGGWEFLVVAFVLLMVVGPKELPAMLRSFTRLTRQMRSMAREFTDGMNKIANEAEVAEIKQAIEKAKRGDLGDVADAIDPGGDIGQAVREARDAVDGDAAGGEVKSIANMVKDVGDEAAQSTVPKASKAKPTAGKKKKSSKKA